MKKKQQKLVAAAVVSTVGKPNIPRTSTASVKARANYGANEDRRVCRRCGSNASHVDKTVQTQRRVVRYRICLECGMRRVTQKTLPTGDLVVRDE